MGPALSLGGDAGFLTNKFVSFGIMRKHPSSAVLETCIYAVLWAIVAAVPLFGYHDADGVHWREVIHYWERVLPFLILFLINNYLLTTLFLNRKRYGIYVVSILLFVGVLFVAVPLSVGRRMPRPIPRFVESVTMEREGWKRDVEEQPQWNDGRLPASSRRVVERHPPWLPMRFKWGYLFNDCLLALLVVGFNVAIRLLFKSMQDARRLRELESQNLKAELQYLKMQVNPHFFMNTLNNIHALIDIDTEKAKETVIDLSRIMRYVLYDADRPTVSLRKEVEFIGNYIELMLPRYRPELLDLQTSYPEEIPDVQIPPLLLVTLMENAFKHGISYRHASFIHSSLVMEQGWIVYTVCNSATGKPASTTGVGLEILRKRLNLLYENQHTFSVEQTDDTFRATLKIPIEYAHTLYSD